MLYVMGRWSSVLSLCSEPQANRKGNQSTHPFTNSTPRWGGQRTPSSGRTPQSQVGLQTRGDLTHMGGDLTVT